MAYDINFPADDSYLSDFPAGDREQNRALKDDQIVNAGRLRGLTVGNENGQIPINNGTENTNLNAALLNGKESSYFATSNHTHTTATQSSNGYMSNADKKKLDGIASGAEVNQNAFANVKVGSTTIQSDAKQDTLELAAGTNISLVGDANNDKVTIAVTGKVASASQADNATNATKATQDGNGNTIATHYLSRTQTTKNDMNTCTTEGIYRFSGTLSNAWTGTSWGTLLVLNNQYNGGSGTSGVYLVQLAFPTDNTIRMRQRVNTGAWTSWVTLARTSDNVASATKATQDSAGQTINTTYVKGVSASNATLTITKGNGSTSTITVNNVANATKATQDSDGQTINSTYLKRSGGTMTGVLTMGTGTEVQIKAPNNTGFYFNSGALGCYNWSGTNGGSIFAYSPSSNTFTFGKAVTAPTPGTSDNSTRVATTAFVQSLINSLKGSIGGTIVASNLAQNGYVKFSNGLILQWGTYNSGRQPYPPDSSTFNFPITFSNSCYQTIVSTNDGGIYTASWTNSQLTIYVKNYNKVNKDNVYINTVRYWAIGI
ncbi:gp53-like domain-containing protein [Megamonas funiformis]|uniref:gp53-like domain-containing protein n=1 Tax=Megamonas funiformis TaxID=437897 RepID=UPI003F7CFE13